MSPLLAFGLGMPGPLELVILGLIVLLFFGNRLPSVMRSLGQGITEFKHGMKGGEDDVDSSAKNKDIT